MLPECPQCKLLPTTSGSRTQVIRFGYFPRKSDQGKIQRFRCKSCRQCFSLASFDPCYWQKKRFLNTPLLELLASGVSQRRATLLLRTTRNTVVRKFLFLGRLAEKALPLISQQGPVVTRLQFDDLETFEHSKCKPLSAIIAVEKDSRWILGFRVAPMPAKGLLAGIARKKYGPRKDERKTCRRELFQELKPLIAEQAVIESDQNPHYPPDVQEFFPNAKHVRYKGRRASVAGLGELKIGGYDPLFSLNHTYAMNRANISRLFRKTWNTTKLAERLGYHLAIYALVHNLVLIQKKPRIVKEALV